MLDNDSSVQPIMRRVATILVVDDEPTIAEFVAVVLQREGHHVLQAEHGPQALKLFALQPHAIDLVVTDVSMPVMDGVEFARHIANLRPGVPFIFMTGHANLGDVSDLCPQPRYLRKPFVRPDIVRTVAEALAAHCPDRA